MTLTKQDIVARRTGAIDQAPATSRVSLLDQPLTAAQLGGITMVRYLADTAHKELGSRACRGTAARPTVAQLNRTMERLQAILDTIDNVVLS